MTYIGNEPFIIDGKSINMTMNDFWRWAYSDLNNSMVLSMLAKFIVASSLKITTIEIKNAHNPVKTYDILSKDGYKINISVAAYIQTLDENHPDQISFSIATINSAGRTAARCEADVLQRNSDIYIFCLYKAQTKNETPLNLDLWDFYILSTKTLNEKKPNQKTITLPSLMRMEPARCDYYGIGKTLQKILTV